MQEGERLQEQLQDKWLIPVPILGALLGGIVGGFVGDAFGSAAFSDTARSNAERKIAKAVQDKATFGGLMGSSRGWADPNDPNFNPEDDKTFQE